MTRPARSRTARAAEAPDDLADARSLLVTTLWLRARGTANMKDALEAALGKTPPAAAITKMAEVGADLVAADRTYRGFVAAVNERQGVGREAVLPPSRWIAEPVSWQTGRPRRVHHRAPQRVGAGADSRRDCRAGDDRAGRGARRRTAGCVLPLTRTIRIQAVVANVGNEAERNLKVEVTLVPAVATGDGARLRQPGAGPAGRRSRSAGSVPIAGQPAELKVRIDAPAGEATPADNEKAIPIVLQ